MGEGEIEMAKVLVACEYSGIVRDAFIEAGHDALSCDLLPSESQLGPHIQGDVLPLLERSWDLVVAHPPCTYLANSGVRWLHDPERGPERWRKLDEGAEFFRRFLSSAPFVAIENPIPHGYAVERIGRRYDQKIQPWQFGQGESKAVCLWLENLPPLTPTDIVEGREQRVFKMGPGPNRQKERSRFFPGIARAMADQWGELI